MAKNSISSGFIQYFQAEVTIQHIKALIILLVSWKGYCTSSYQGSELVKQLFMLRGTTVMGVWRLHSQHLWSTHKNRGSSNKFSQIKESLCQEARIKATTCCWKDRLYRPIRGEYKTWILKHYLAPSIPFLLMIDTTSEQCWTKIQSNLNKFNKKWLNLPRYRTLAAVYHPDVINLLFLPILKSKPKKNFSFGVLNWPLYQRNFSTFWKTLNL